MTSFSDGANQIKEAISRFVSSDMEAVPLNQTLELLDLDQLRKNGRKPFHPDNEYNTKSFVLSIENPTSMQHLMDSNFEISSLFMKPKILEFAQLIMELNKTDELKYENRISYRLMMLSCPSEEVSSQDPINGGCFKLILKVKEKCEEELLIDAIISIQNFEPSSEQMNDMLKFSAQIIIKDIQRTPSIVCYFALKSICD